jgi:Reverse transcriptase (RNA-dependent DNA polymerase)
MMLPAYVDDMIVTDDDEKDIAQLKVKLSKELEVNDLSLFQYFFEIEIARGAEGMIISQRKYALDLLTETSMLECRGKRTS